MAPHLPSHRLVAHDERNYDDFIQQFMQQETEKRIARKPKPLTAAQHTALRQQLKEVRFLQPDYADGTKLNISGILRKWEKYCASVKLEGSWKDIIKEADRNMMMSFLFYLCETYKITSWGTSWEYFRQFKQLYASATGRYVDRNDSREILKWHDGVLVSHFKLQPPNSGGKEVADVGDLLALQTFNFAFDTGIFALERHRIQLSACYLILAYTGARPAEIVNGEKKKPKDGSWEELFGPKAGPKAAEGISKGDSHDKTPEEEAGLLEKLISQQTTDRGRPKALCYEDIMLMVVRHPETGRDVLMMSIKFSHHKGADNKPKPTIFYFTMTRRLIFCLITVIVSLAVLDGAFEAPSLTCARRVFEVRNSGPTKCTQLRWKQEWLKRPIFRQIYGAITSVDEPLPYHRLRDDMARQSLDCGCEKAIEPKAWRRGAANKANGNAPDAVRDQMMRHDPKWATFNSAYINEKVQFHLQNAFLDEPTEDRVIGLVTHLGLTRDPRAKKDMVPSKVWRRIPPDPEIEELKTRRQQLKDGRYQVRGTEIEQEVQSLSATIRRKEAQRKKTIKENFRKHYFHNRPTWEVEKQALGRDEEYVEPAISLQIPERARLAEILCGQSEDLSVEELSELRIEAADLMIALCDKRETAKRGNAEEERTIAEPPKRDPFPLLMDKTQCPRCIGDERQSLHERTFRYCRPSVMCNHFDKTHTRQLEAAKQIKCNHPKCATEALVFEHLDHFKSHVDRVHGVRLRP